MQHQEKKYRVNSFTTIKKKLEEVGAQQNGRRASTHYYVFQAGNGVIKLVVQDGKAEIHILEESNGKFSLKENIPMESKEAGLRWLKDKDYQSAGIVKMAHIDYSHKGGKVGLYVINDFLYSVMLDSAEGQHEAMARELGLEDAETITVLYNKYLEQHNRLDLRPLV